MILKESLLQHRARVATVVKLLINSSLLLRVLPSLVSSAVFLVVPVFFKDRLASLFNILFNPRQLNLTVVFIVPFINRFD